MAVNLYDTNNWNSTTTYSIDGIVKNGFKSIPLDEFEKQIYANLVYEEKPNFFQAIKNLISRILSCAKL